MVQRIPFVDSHTGGEPTRVVLAGGPPLGTGPLSERWQRFRRDHDDFRRSVVNEPRGNDVLVGALLLTPHAPDCQAGVIFFDNLTSIQMCGHGTIGLVVTLAHLGRVAAGELRIETPVGIVTAGLHDDGRVSVTNVPSFRRVAGVEIDTPQLGRLVGDVAWGGNWFFITAVRPPRWGREAAAELTAAATEVRHAVHAAGHDQVDHVMLLGPDDPAQARRRNFVLCPGLAYDRSPCGTGTSALVACLAADGRLAEGQPLQVESIVGSRFEARFRWLDPAAGQVEPTITGSAHITATGQLIVDPHDPFACGFP